MARRSGYSLAGYGEMINERERMAAYARALQHAVQQGCSVLDIGAGTGVFSLLACQFGASEVYAVEPDDAVHVARDIAEANGYAERITFHQALSTEMSLPQPVDVIVSDLRGVLPLFQQHIPSIADARQRLLAPGGVLIPQRDTLWAALVEDAEGYRRYAEPWLSNEFDLDMRAGQPLVVNTWRKTYATAEQLLARPQQWATLDYGRIEDPNVAGELTWTVERAGTAHGLLLWFDAELGGGAGFSNAPGAPKLIYGQAFFPLQSPVSLLPGDKVDVALRADLTADDYTWQWYTRVGAAGDAAQLKANFRQSTFFGHPLALNKLQKQEARFRPVLNQTGAIDAFMLSLMDGETALEEIARRTLEQFPEQFAGLGTALTHAGELSLKYSR